MLYEVHQSDFLTRLVVASYSPVESKQDDVRYFHIHENDQFDEELVTGWIRQASELPGEELF